MSLNVSSDGLTLFMHTPPEHTAHIVNAACLFSGLQRLGVSAQWITMNPRNPAHLLNPSLGLAGLGLDEFADECNVEVLNCAPWVSDEFSPEPAAIRRLLSKTRTRVLYMHYYPPFWGPVVDACRDEGIRVGLHVQCFDRRPNDRPFFLEYAGALDGLRKADFLTVSQPSDVCGVCELAFKSPDHVAVVPKSVPPRALELAREAVGGDPALSTGHAVLPSCIPTITYVGRLERFKSIDWFLEQCLPQLADRADEFNVLIVGRGTAQNDVAALADRFDNVRLSMEQVRYDEALRIVAQSDLLLFPSGFDYSPRLPLEAMLLGTPVVMGRFAFSQRFHGDASWLVEMAGTASDVLDYTGLEVEYGLLNPGQMVDAIRQFLDQYRRGDPRPRVPALLDSESQPTFGASRLLSIATRNEPRSQGTA